MITHNFTDISERTLYCGNDLSIFETSFLLVYTRQSRTNMFSVLGRNFQSNHFCNFIENFLVVIFAFFMFLLSQKLLVSF